MSAKREIIATKDGSKTLYFPELDAHYHSMHGALQESRHIFIQTGLAARKEERVRILECGFGSGLNALLAAEYAFLKGLEVHYVAVEKFPLDADEYALLDYAALLLHPAKAEEWFQRLHQSPWSEEVSIHPHFQLVKWQVDMAQMPKLGEFDLVFFDAFAPSAQAELWTEEIFKNLYEQMATGACLCTYCVKGEVRRRFQSVGFEVEKLAGPPGKREIMRAWKR